MDNPYETPKETGITEDLRPRLPVWQAIFGGGLISVLSAFPIAAILVSVFRFPIPFGGYVSGPKYIFMAMIAVLMYGIALGGFLLLAAVGAIAGAVGRAAGSTIKRQRRIGWLLSLIASFLLLLLLATLDWFIGNW